MSGAAAVSAAKNRRSRSDNNSTGSKSQQQQQQQQQQPLQERVELTPLQALHQHDYRIKQIEHILKGLLNEKTEDKTNDTIQETIELFNERIVSLEKYIDEDLSKTLNMKEKEDKDGKKCLSPVHGLVNGSRGIVTSFSADGYPIVKFLNGKTVVIKPATWSLEDEPESLKREQIPLRVAYALTIHKAQGASLDSALIDVGPSTFEYGQAYVALSRVRSLESLYIFEISPRAFRANPTVKAFYSTKIEASCTNE